MRTGAPPPRLITLIGAAALGLAGPAAAQPPPAQPPAARPLQVYAAGSLKAAMGELIARSGLPPDQVAPPVFGPAGALGDRIADGAAADLLASADMAQPRRFARPGHPVVLFARNRICALSRPGLRLDAADFLDRLLNPRVRVATSRPGVDPSGDYAQALFARADRLHPGAEAALTAKAIRLGGAPAKPARSLNPAADLFLSDAADVLLTYCSGAAALSREVPGLVATPAPPELAPRVEFGMAVLSDRPLAARLTAFILSPQGQDILARNGFIPLRAAVTPPGG